MAEVNEIMRNCVEGMIVHFLFQHTAIGILNEAVVGKLKIYQRGGVLCNLLLN